MSQYLWLVAGCWLLVHGKRLLQCGGPVGRSTFQLGKAVKRIMAEVKYRPYNRGRLVQGKG